MTGKNFVKKKPYECDVLRRFIKPQALLKQTVLYKDQNLIIDAKVFLETTHDTTSKFKILYYTVNLHLRAVIKKGNIRQ